MNAVSLAVEKLYPEAGSVIELGGQDAKIIIFGGPGDRQEDQDPVDERQVRRGHRGGDRQDQRQAPDPPDQLCDMGYDGIKLHPVAGKCGVFAETDINSLQKMGVPPDQLMASLFDAIIGQNLSVLTRGNTLRPHVLLLGGPNTLHPRAWWRPGRHAIPIIWKERNAPARWGRPHGADPRPGERPVLRGDGPVQFGKSEEEGVGAYRGTENLRTLHRRGPARGEAGGGRQGPRGGRRRARGLRSATARRVFEEATFDPGEVVEGFIGLDGGSTSTKAVLLDRDRNVLVKSYQLSKGNPTVDTQEVWTSSRRCSTRAPP